MADSMWEMFKQVVLCQVYAPWLMMDVPRFHRVAVTGVKHMPAGSRDMLYCRYRLEEPEEQPEEVLITTTSGDICIDVGTGAIADADWRELGGHQYLGSAGLGIAIMGLPGLLLSVPLLVAVHVAYAILARVTGMDRHDMVLWWKLRNQLPNDVGVMAKLALLHQLDGVNDRFLQQQRDEADTKPVDIDGQPFLIGDVVRLVMPGAGDGTYVLERATRMGGGRRRVRLRESVSGETLLLDLPAEGVRLERVAASGPV